MSRHYNLNKTSYFIAYSIEDIVSLYGVDNSTVRRWIKNEGLKTIDSKQPFLIYGMDLKKFLGKLNSRKKQSMDINEMFCTGCQMPQIPFKREIAIQESNNKTLKLKGLCPKCKSTMNVCRSINNYQELKNFFTFSTPEKLELYKSKSTSTNERILNQDKNKISVHEEPIQLGLFVGGM